MAGNRERDIDLEEDDSAGDDEDDTEHKDYSRIM
jgi:hypothetical protein